MNAKLSREVIARLRPPENNSGLANSRIADFVVTADELRALCDMALGQAAGEPVGEVMPDGREVSGTVRWKAGVRLPIGAKLYLHPAEGAESILRELVACKDLRERMTAAVVNPATPDIALHRKLEAEYKRRKPLVWQAARAHVGGKP